VCSLPSSYWALGMSFQAQTEQTWLRIRVQRWRQPPSPGSVGGHSLGRPLPPGPGSPSRPAYVSAGNPHTASSRIRPRTTGKRQETTRTAGGKNRQVRKAHSTSFAGSKIGLENPLKVETRVQIPLGLRPKSSSPKDLMLLGELAGKGEIRPVIDRSYPLEELAEAHTYVDDGHKAGNVVIAVAHRRLAVSRRTSASTWRVQALRGLRMLYPGSGPRPCGHSRIVRDTTPARPPHARSGSADNVPGAATGWE
jgi:hypothetical protein